MFVPIGSASQENHVNMRPVLGGNLETLPETNIFAPENRPSQKENGVFQPSIFRCYVSLSEGV